MVLILAGAGFSAYMIREVHIAIQNTEGISETPRLITNETAKALYAEIEGYKQEIIDAEADIYWEQKHRILSQYTQSQAILLQKNSD